MVLTNVSKTAATNGRTGVRGGGVNLESAAELV